MRNGFSRSGPPARFSFPPRSCATHDPFPFSSPCVARSFHPRTALMSPFLPFSPFRVATHRPLPSIFRSVPLTVFSLFRPISSFISSAQRSSRTRSTSVGPITSTSAVPTTRGRNARPTRNPAILPRQPMSCSHKATMSSPWHPPSSVLRTPPPHAVRRASIIAKMHTTSPDIPQLSIRLIHPTTLPIPRILPTLAPAPTLNLTRLIAQASPLPISLPSIIETASGLWKGPGRLLLSK